MKLLALAGLTWLILTGQRAFAEEYLVAWHQEEHCTHSCDDRSNICGGTCYPAKLQSQILPSESSAIALLEAYEGSGVWCAGCNELRVEVSNSPCMEGNVLFGCGNLIELELVEEKGLKKKPNIITNSIMIGNEYEFKKSECKPATCKTECWNNIINPTLLERCLEDCEDE